MNPGDDLSTKLCPYCAEAIKEAAIKCRFCGEFLISEGLVTVKEGGQPWYQKTSSIIMGFFVVGPFVLPLVWRHPAYSLTKKIIISVIVVAISWGLLKAFVQAIKNLQEYYQLIFP